MTEPISTAVASTTEITSETGIIPEISAETTKENISRLSKLLNSLGSYVLHALPSILFAIFVLVVGFFVIKLLMKLISKGFSKTKIDKTLQGFLKSIIKILLYVLLILTVLTLLNIPVASIITLLGTAGLAVVLALKNSLSNVAGGFIILLSKPLKAGDRIEFDGTDGYVEKVDILYTTLRTFDNSVVHIPNGKITDNKIINYSEKDIRRCDLKFGVGYDSDVKQVKNILLDICDKDADVLKDPKPAVYMDEQGDSALIFVIHPWVKTENYWKVHYRIIEDAKKRFDEAGIEIPYPQIDVHEKN